jgi:hypothetical protein
MRRRLEEDGSRANPNKFILHWWLSRHEYTAERKLFRLIKSKVTKAEAGLTVNQLVTDAQYYARLAHPDGWKAQKHEQGIRRSLVALNMFGVRQPRPLLLAVLRSLAQGEIDPADARHVTRAIEVFHFVTTAVVGVSSTGGISEMYAKHARELTNAANKSQRQKTLRQLVAKLADTSRFPKRETFISEFPRALRYSEEEPNAKRLVQYTLSRLHVVERPGFPLQGGVIEHLAPQSEISPWLAEIGNLLWVTQELNLELSNLPFHKKQLILAKSPRPDQYALADVLAADAWTALEVGARSRRLAELAYDKAWTIEV